MPFLEGTNTDLTTKLCFAYEHNIKNDKNVNHHFSTMHVVIGNTLAAFKASM